MKTLRILSFFLFAAVPLLSMGQDEFTLPSPTAGKALIIFTRPALDAPVVKFKYFCNDQYLGKIGVGSYLVYECDPGKYLFWADSETTRLVKAEVAADEVYIFDTVVQSGMLKPNLTLKPFDPASKRADRIRQRLIDRISKKNEQRFDPAHGEVPGKKLQRTARKIMEQNPVEPVEGDGTRWSDVQLMAASQHL